MSVVRARVLAGADAAVSNAALDAAMDAQRAAADAELLVLSTGDEAGAGAGAGAGVVRG